MKLLEAQFEIQSFHEDAEWPKRISSNALQKIEGIESLKASFQAYY
jgi:hypothetical protein